jgi:hypothetical protein
MSTVIRRGVAAMLIVVALLMAPGSTRAQSAAVSQSSASAAEHVATAADSAGIRQAALDYIEGWSLTVRRLSAWRSCAPSS